MVIRKKLHKYVDHARIGVAVQAAESQTAGEIVVAVSPWFWGSVETAANRTFDRLGIGKTRRHTGVLIFVCPRRRAVTIVADRAIHEQAGQPLWDAAVACVRDGARAGDLTAGIIAAIQQIGDELAKRFPRQADDTNELADGPVRVT